MESGFRFLCLFILLMVHAGSVTAQRHEHGNSVVVIDQEIPYLEILLKGIKPGSRKVFLDKSAPALEAINNIIREHAPISSLHILTQGRSGALVFSVDEITSETIEQNEALVETWKQYFINHGDIILYGSDVGKGNAGLKFVTTLAVFTGLDVAASKDLTGATLKHGDWLMELRSGHIESTLIVSKQIRAEYPTVLNPTISKRLFGGIF